MLNYFINHEPEVRSFRRVPLNIHHLQMEHGMMSGRKLGAGGHMIHVFNQDQPIFNHCFHYNKTTNQLDGYENWPSSRPGNTSLVEIKHFLRFLRISLLQITGVLYGFLAGNLPAASASPRMTSQSLHWSVATPRLGLERLHALSQQGRSGR